MNKITVLVSLMILCLCASCEGETSMISEVYEFSYKGHDYISFEGNNYKEGFSVVHSPECETCSKQCNNN